MILFLYRILMRASGPILFALLKHRVSIGKEDPVRLNERMGHASKEKPKGKLLWIHAASVGEAQSALILVERMLRKHAALHILVTSGTKTSANLMAHKLPDRAFHQYYPLDHPGWSKKFLQHWKPDLIFWMESELWPNMIMAINKQNIPAALINARLSDRSFHRWSWIHGSAKQLIDSFSLVLCQTEQDQQHFKQLGHMDAHCTGNIKYSAAPLDYNEKDLAALQKSCAERPLWLYASTHDGEEELAAQIHRKLKRDLPEILTIIVPRHPERRSEIASKLDTFNIDVVFRDKDKNMPKTQTDLYVANTLGELGLFYRLAPFTMIGRSFSNDGGGGHNPIEAARLGCGVLYGPHVQNLQTIFDDMKEHKAALQTRNVDHLHQMVSDMFFKPQSLLELQENAEQFAQEKNGVIRDVMMALKPLIKSVL